MNPQKLRITEIFYSLQGETTLVGLPTIFIRLTGCPLRCGYCDTEYAFKGGEWFEIPDILNTIKKYKTKYVTVTGGEPLAQKACLDLLTLLCDNNYAVSLETSGALPIEQIDKRVIKIVDIKTPGSGEVDKNLFANFDHLTTQDQLKIVICNREDYAWAKAIIEKYNLTKKCEVLFSPAYEKLPNHDLAEWILQDQLNVRMQLQMHKVIWGNIPGK